MHSKLLKEANEILGTYETFNSCSTKIGEFLASSSRYVQNSTQVTNAKLLENIASLQISLNRLVVILDPTFDFYPITEACEMRKLNDEITAKLSLKN